MSKTTFARVPLTGATLPENVHGGVAEQDLSGVHAARQDGHDDSAQLQLVPELREVLALLFANLVDGAHQEVDDESDEHQLSIIAHRPRPRHRRISQYRQ